MARLTPGLLAALAFGSATASLAQPPAASTVLFRNVRVADLRLIEDPEKNLLVIMKDGKIYKNRAER